MFQSIKDAIVKKFALGWLKGKLDALPLDGFKTALGILLLILSELSKQVDPSEASYAVIKLILEGLAYLGAENISDAGLVALIVGTIHKALKLIERKAAN